MQTEEMERAVAMLSKSDMEALDYAANEEGLSRSAMIRTLIKRYLRERGEKA